MLAPAGPVEQTSPPAPSVNCGEMLVGNSTNSSTFEEGVAGPLFVTVTVYFMSEFVCAGLGETVCETERSTSPGATTLSVACAVCDSGPLVALTTNVCAPVGASAEVPRLRAAVCGDESVMLTAAV